MVGVDFEFDGGVFFLFDFEFDEGWLGVEVEVVFGEVVLCDGECFDCLVDCCWVDGLYFYLFL